MSTFPGNIVDELSVSFKQYMSDHAVLGRPVRTSDPNFTVGIFMRTWNPDERSVQMGDQWEPVLNRYAFTIQNLVKHGDEEMGRAEFSAKAKSVRAILYRDTALHVRLRALTETVLGSTEVTKRFGVTGQRFLNNGLDGTFLYLAATDFWLETETVKS